MIKEGEDVEHDHQEEERILRSFIAFAVLAAMLAHPAMAAQKRYEGSEAAALRCANMVALTGVALADAGRIGEPEKEVMLAISFLMLEEHVSGTWAEKQAALEVVRDRRDVEETLDDFARYVTICMRDFPIN